MAEAQIVVDVEASPLSLSESMEPKLDRGKTNEAKTSTIMEEAQIVVDLEASPLSESMQPELNRGKTNEAKNSTIMEEAQIVVDLKTSLQRQLNTLSGNPHEVEIFTIFRTPHNIFQSKKKLFEPSVISIGPFHRGKKHLRAMEEQKRRFLRDFLFRWNHITLDLCISQMKLLETRTRRCYSETFDDLDSDTFVEMMLLDGCFLVEHFLKSSEGNSNSFSEVGWNSYFVRNDMVLLENQIPFFIVDKLYELIGYNQDRRMAFGKYIALRLLPLGSIIANRPVDSIELAEMPNPSAEIHHLTHLCYHYLVPNPDKPLVLSSKLFHLTTPFSTDRTNGFLLGSLSRLLTRILPNSTRNISGLEIPSATELKQKGVKFTPKSNPKHMFDISFEYGVLKIPQLNFVDFTKLIFANLLAFDHSKFGRVYSPVRTFLHFLDCLVTTPNDVTILQECGIIKNYLGSEEELAHFLNQITEGNILYREPYFELYREVNRYIGSCWNRQRAILIRDYFSSPWAAISLVAALILLVLTCVQSFYAVYAYKFPPSP